MNLVPFLVVSCTLIGLSDVAHAECQCFEEFHVEKRRDDEFCRGEKNHRIFHCGEEKPPICQCRRNGTIEELDIGETYCTLTIYDNQNCEPREAWENYLTRFPSHRILD
ncbi:hypothetical protein HHI36_000550 [Cryptolaemus montrouzieri]|uniref:Uncharacterized protein n=1 Tax=Cryptolaemus montrouzieri TaxID=559131 RepID=A0ABD2P5Y9_9CUCU